MEPRPELLEQILNWINKQGFYTGNESSSKTLAGASQITVALIDQAEMQAIEERGIFFRQTKRNLPFTYVGMVSSKAVEKFRSLCYMSESARSVVIESSSSGLTINDFNT